MSFKNQLTKYNTFGEPNSLQYVKFFLQIIFLHKELLIKITVNQVTKYE